MAWVLISLRKAELQRLHSDYQAEELQISREERQMSRQYQYEQLLVRNEEQSTIRDLKTNYNEEKSALYDQVAEMRQAAKDNGESSSDYTNADGKTIADIYNLINDLQENYTQDVNDERTIYEEDLAALEEEAADTETYYEQRKVTVETQMEAVAQELQAVGQAISQEIQNSTVKLS